MDKKQCKLVMTEGRRKRGQHRQNVIAHPFDSVFLLNE